MLAALCGFWLVGCGGGDGDDSAPQERNRQPTAEAGPAQSVDENTLVILSGSGADADGTITRYTWAQTSGAPVSLEAADTAEARFAAPQVDADEDLVFRLTVTDDDGAAATDTVTITVMDTVVPNMPAHGRGRARPVR